MDSISGIRAVISGGPGGSEMQKEDKRLIPINCTNELQDLPPFGYCQ